MPERAKHAAAWTEIAFGDVVRQVKDRVDLEQSGLERYVAGEHMDTDDLRLRRWGEIGDGYLGPAFHMRFKSGHVLYGSRRTYLRKVAVADFEGITANTTYVLEPKDPNVLLPELLPFIMQTEAFNQHSVRESKGSVNPYVNFSDLAWYEFALPPIEEQRRLAGALQAAQHVIESLATLLMYVRATQAAAFEDLIDRCSPKQCELGEILIQPPRNGCSAQAVAASTGHWVLALSAISRWGYRPGELKAVVRTPAMESAVLSKGDLVISRSNTRDLVGLVAVFPEKRSDVSYPDTMMRLAIDPKKVDAHYLEMCLRSRECRRQIQSFAAGTSASMKKINGANLQKIQVPLISPSDQVAVLAQVNSFDLAVSETERRLTKARHLKSGILDVSFGNCKATM